MLTGLWRAVRPYAAGLLIGVVFSIALLDWVKQAEPDFPRLAPRAASNPGESPPVAKKSTPEVATPEVASVPLPPKSGDASPPVPAAAAKQSPILAPAPPADSAPRADPAPTAREPQVESPLPAPLPVEAHSPTTEPGKNQVTVFDQTFCGPPPPQPGFGMNHYLACVWRNQCLMRANKALRMIEEGRSRCPGNGPNAQSCQNYYRSLESRYQPSMCSQMEPSSGGGGPTMPPYPPLP
ncbi:MAG: hypothetical protein HQL51_15720 [Magnetococcales bacterium]|nr:hypothetical protein [Magnetococcales bacterium]